MGYLRSGSILRIDLTEGRIDAEPVESYTSLFIYWIPVFTGMAGRSEIRLFVRSSRSTGVTQVHDPGERQQSEDEVQPPVDSHRSHAGEGCRHLLKAAVAKICRHFRGLDELLRVMGPLRDDADNILDNGNRRKAG